MLKAVALKSRVDMQQSPKTDFLLRVCLKIRFDSTIGIGLT